MFAFNSAVRFLTRFSIGERTMMPFVIPYSSNTSVNISSKMAATEPTKFTERRFVSYCAKLRFASCSKL